jgi:hypothetical protein
MKKSDKLKKLALLQGQHDDIEQEIARLKIEIFTPLKDGFYVSTYRDDGELRAVVFHIFDGYAHCLNGYFEVNPGCTREALLQELSRHFEKPTLKKVSAQEAILYLD